VRDNIKCYDDGDENFVGGWSYEVLQIVGLLGF